MEVTGTLIWYYNICKREVWLMSHNIVPDQNDDNIDFGRFLHENSYKRNKKEVLFGNVKFDVILESKDMLVIGETKKSSSYEEESKWQLMYYLRVLKRAGIMASGQLLYPLLKRRVDVILDENGEEKLNIMENEIITITEMELPPEVKKCKYCKNCGYNEYCYA